MMDTAYTIDPDLDLPRHAYLAIAHMLGTMLPPPPTHAPEDRIRRDLAAVAKVAATAPANTMEAEFAVQAVAASAHAADCLRAASARDLDPTLGFRYRAQAALMMRQSHGAMRALHQMQAERRKLEASKDRSADRAAWAEHRTGRLLAEAVPGVTFAEPEPADDIAEAEPEPAPAAAPTGPTLAEEYAMNYPDRAALIRRHGGIPDGVTFGPPEQDVVHGLLTETSAVILDVDKLPPRAGVR